DLGLGDKAGKAVAVRESLDFGHPRIVTSSPKCRKAGFAGKRWGKPAATRANHPHDFTKNQNSLGQAFEPDRQARKPDRRALVRQSLPRPLVNRTRQRMFQSLTVAVNLRRSDTPKASCSRGRRPRLQPRFTDVSRPFPAQLRVVWHFFSVRRNIAAAPP